MAEKPRFRLLDPPMLHEKREPNVPFDSCGFCQLQQAYQKSVKEFQAHQDVVAKENREKKRMKRCWIRPFFME
jgi:hypothetical protein